MLDCAIIYTLTFQYEFKLMKLLSRIHTWTQFFSSQTMQCDWINIKFVSVKKKCANIFCMVQSEVEAHAFNHFICRECETHTFLPSFSHQHSLFFCFYCCCCCCYYFWMPSVVWFAPWFRAIRSPRIFFYLCSTFLWILSIK